MCVAAGGGATWMAVTAGPWWFAAAGVFLVGMSIAYIARPTERRLGWLMIAWGGGIVLRWIATGTSLAFGSGIAAGGSTGVILGAGLLLAGFGKLGRHEPG